MGTFTTKPVVLTAIPKSFPQLTAWSFSLYRRYESCPRMVAMEKMVRKGSTQNKGMERGTDMHTTAENFASGATKSAKVPEPLLLVADHAKLLRKDKATEVELEMAFTAQWAITSWFADNTWLRVKVDARRVISQSKRKIEVVEVTDWKSGKPYAFWDTQQAELYALAEFIWSGANEVRTTFQHTDTGDVTDGVFTKDEMPGLKKEWLKRTKKMLADKRFGPKPGRQCAWCPFSAKNKGGPCREG